MATNPENTPTKAITFRVQRYQPEVDAGPHWEQYVVQVGEGMTVLEALHAIKNEQDHTLAWRSSCRMGICGSCAMYINHLPQLACQTQVLHLNTNVVEVAPLPNFDNVRDLVPDLVAMFEHHAEIKPHLINEEKAAQDLSVEYLQTPEQREEFGQFSMCIKCGICMAACPTRATDADFLGPQPLAQAYRYIIDSRDQGFSQRLARLESFDGLYNCHLAGACTDACPKGVDPALGIQLLKRTLVMNALGWGGKKPATPTAPLRTEYVANDQIPKPPDRTV
ncbi:MAG TPA: succinate dehydrogenase iron-sulfur subunit [Anaerolineaceae bacterium]|nr:succinate dehydrogenase iron-sulfur subunit [Anaerolineaceae bacterium]